MSDFKLYAINLSSLVVSMTSVEPILKITLLVVTIGYTLHKWFHLVNEKKNK